MTFTSHLAVLGAASLIALAVPASAQSPKMKPAARMEKHESTAQLKGEAKITPAAARATALARVPGGRVKSSELERENGKLVYSFDIATKGKSGIDEVLVDAITGAVVGDVVHETPRMEAAEKKAEAKEMKMEKKAAKKP